MQKTDPNSSLLYSKFIFPIPDGLWQITAKMRTLMSSCALIVEPFFTPSRTTTTTHRLTANEPQRKKGQKHSVVWAAAVVDEIESNRKKVSEWYVSCAPPLKTWLALGIPVSGSISERRERAREDKAFSWRRTSFPGKLVAGSGDDGFLCYARSTEVNQLILARAPRMINRPIVARPWSPRTKLQRMERWESFQSFRTLTLRRGTINKRGYLLPSKINEMPKLSPTFETCIPWRSMDGAVVAGSLI